MVEDCNWIHLVLEAWSFCFGDLFIEIVLCYAKMKRSIEYFICKECRYILLGNSKILSRWYIKNEFNNAYDLKILVQNNYNFLKVLKDTYILCNTYCSITSFFQGVNNFSLFIKCISKFQPIHLSLKVFVL